MNYVFDIQRQYCEVVVFSVNVKQSAPCTLQLQRVDFFVCAFVRYPALYINICLLFCVFGEPMWICLGAQGSIQQQTGGYPSQSLCLTGGFAPTVSKVSTNTLGYNSSVCKHTYFMNILIEIIAVYQYGYFCLCRIRVVTSQFEYGLCAFTRNDDRNIVTFC